jgi:RNA polymerase sigma-70 factor (ECF subfamily)
LTRVPSPWIEETFRANAPFVANSLRRFGIPASDVRDQVQEVFLVVTQVEASFDTARPVRPWLFGIAYRVAGRYRQARHRGGYDRGGGEVPDVSDPAPLPDAVLSTKQAQDLALRALEYVELSRRAVFILADIEGEPIPSIAEALQIPTNTAYSRLRLAREEFKSALGRMTRRESPS